MAAIVWWEIETADPERFIAFHAELSGWTFAPDDAGMAATGYRYWTIRRDGESIGGVQQAPDDAYPPSVGVRLFLDTDDLEGTLALVADLGGMTQQPRTLVGTDRWYAVFTDPGGVSWGLWTGTPAR